jgi:hypothetical protein
MSPPPFSLRLCILASRVEEDSEGACLILVELYKYAPWTLDIGQRSTEELSCVECKYKDKYFVHVNGVWSMVVANECHLNSERCRHQTMPMLLLLLLLLLRSTLYAHAAMPMPQVQTPYYITP